MFVLLVSQVIYAFKKSTNLSHSLGDIANFRLCLRFGVDLGDSFGLLVAFFRVVDDDSFIASLERILDLI